MLTLRSCVALIAFALAATVRAATNLVSTDEIPPLLPPRREIAPGFWEHYSSWVTFGILLLLVGAGALVWRLRRPKPPPIITPPALEAHRSLESLQTQVESGVVLSRVSRILRQYFSLTFGLPPAERTTTEFCQALASSPHVGRELSTSVGDFLRQCDERKFAPSPPQQPLGAVSIASRLIKEAETNRTNPSQLSPAPSAPQ